MAAKSSPGPRARPFAGECAAGEKEEPAMARKRRTLFPPAGEQGGSHAKRRRETQEEKKEEREDWDWDKPLCFMLLDVAIHDQKGAGPALILLYGLTKEGRTVCCHVADFVPYFWFPSPVQENGNGPESMEIVKDLLNQKLALSRKKTGAAKVEPMVAEISSAYRTPIMYYRPNSPFPFLKVKVWKDKDIGTVAKELKSLAENRELRSEGMTWNDVMPYEEDIKLGMRFLCDTSLAGGAWVELQNFQSQSTDKRVSSCHVEVAATSWKDLKGLTPDATYMMEFNHVEGKETRRTAVEKVDLAATLREDHELGLGVEFNEEGWTSDPTITEDFFGNEGRAGEGGREGENKRGEEEGGKCGSQTSLKGAEFVHVPPLRLLTLDVQFSGGGRITGGGIGDTCFRSEGMAKSSFENVKVGKARSNGQRGKSTVRPTAKKSAPKKHELDERTNGNTNRNSDSLKNASIEGVGASGSTDIGDIEVLGGVAGGGSAVPSRDPILMITSRISEVGSHSANRKVVFTHGNGLLNGRPTGVEVRTYASEAEMLKAWQIFVVEEVDPDVLCVFQLRDSLKYLVERCKVLKMGGLEIGRHRGQATKVKSVVTYGKRWVKQQARMTATSNQEVFRATVAGRMVVDVLRAVLLAHNLTTFSLAECSQVFLKQTKEVLSPAAIANLWEGRHGGVPRLILYSLHEAELAERLMHKLQTVTEIIEMARVTGLTIPEVLYKAQMIRVQSLLLRSARLEDWLLGGPTIQGQLSESPFLLHPKENNTVGLHHDPVAILDFASLYPSLYIAHNLCYSTLLHPDDAASMPDDSVLVSPTGARFVVPEVRRGVLPRVCSALITARQVARSQMAAEGLSTAERAVLDGRQKALKLCSNALYGYTGAQASPQQAFPLADSCLSMGAASCRAALEVVERNFENAKVLYAQTDSLFVAFRGASIAEAIELGKRAAELASAAFRPPMNLKFERVVLPFLLLQVNRYAGRQYPGGSLFARGVEVARRDVPPFVRAVCGAVLQLVLVDNDVQGAMDLCRREIRRLMAGKCSLYELLMTGGLWRVDDADISRVAAGEKREVSGPATAEEGRGPHVALAVRLKRRDPDRQFHVGERIPYVLLANQGKLQDEMAEDPIEALLANRQPNTAVYLENKLRKPLESILEHVVDAGQLRELFTGSHTVPPPAPNHSAPHGKQALVSSFFKPKPVCVACRRPMDASGRALCGDCKAASAGQVAAVQLVQEEAEGERHLSRACSSCLRCHSGGIHGGILCTSLDCPVFFSRYESSRALQPLRAALGRLVLDC